MGLNTGIYVDGSSIWVDNDSTHGELLTSTKLKVNNAFAKGVKYITGHYYLKAFDAIVDKTNIDDNFDVVADGCVVYGGKGPDGNKLGYPDSTYTSGTHYIWFNAFDSTLYHSTSRPSYNSTGDVLRKYDFTVDGDMKEVFRKAVKIYAGWCAGGGGGGGGYTSAFSGGAASGGSGAAATSPEPYYLIATKNSSEFYYIVFSIGSGGGGASGGSKADRYGSAGGASKVGWGSTSLSNTWSYELGPGNGGSSNGGTVTGGYIKGLAPANSVYDQWPYNLSYIKNDSVPGSTSAGGGSGGYAGNPGGSGGNIYWTPHELDVIRPFKDDITTTKENNKDIEVIYHYGGTTWGNGGGGGASYYGNGGGGGNGDNKYSAGAGGYGAGGGGGSYAYIAWGGNGGNGGSGVLHLWYV